MNNRTPLLILFLTIFIDLLGFGLVIPILPNLVTEIFSKPEWMAGIVAAVYSFSQFLFAPFWGTLSDRIGRRPVILISVVITALSYAFFSYSTLFAIFPILMVYRFMAGLGSANISAANAYVADISTKENRAKSMGLVGAAFGMGFIFGPPLGGAIKDNYGVEYVGYFAAALCIINLVSAYFFLPESLKEKQTGAKFSFRPITEVAMALRRPIIKDLFLLNFIFIAAFSMMQITAALLWKNFYDLNDENIGYVFAFIGVSSTVVQGGLIGPLNKRFGEKNLLVYGFVLMAAGLGVMPFVPVNLFVPLELISLLMIALANGCIMPSLLSLISQNTIASEQGKMLGLNQSFGSLARVAGPILGAALYQAYHKLPYISAAIMLLLALFLVFSLFDRIKKSKE